ncbi:AAA family ATPase, partial [Acinetobacter baumannii]
RNSIIIFDGDEKEGNKFKNTLCLPGTLPPDQLLFDFLYRLPADDMYWKNNKISFSKPVFLRIASPILEFFNLDQTPTENYDLETIILEKRASSSESGGKAREKFKNFYKNEIIQSLIKGKISDNPFRVMIDYNPEKYNTFQEDFKKTLLYVISTNHPTMKDSIKDFLKIK